MHAGGSLPRRAIAAEGSIRRRYGNNARPGQSSLAALLGLVTITTTRTARFNGAAKANASLQALWVSLCLTYLGLTHHCSTARARQLDNGNCAYRHIAATLANNHQQAAAAHAARWGPAGGTPPQARIRYAYATLWRHVAAIWSVGPYATTPPLSECFSGRWGISGRKISLIYCVVPVIPFSEAGTWTRDVQARWPCAAKSRHQAPPAVPPDHQPGNRMDRCGGRLETLSRTAVSGDRSRHLRARAVLRQGTLPQSPAPSPPMIPQDLGNQSGRCTFLSIGVDEARHGNNLFIMFIQ